MREDDSTESEEEEAGDQLGKDDQRALFSPENCFFEGVLPHVDEDGLLNKF